jgi:multidrug resistance efflux pump
MLAAAGGVALAALGGAGALRSRGEAGAFAGAVIEARPGPFVRAVEAEGVLAAIQATPVVAPPSGGRSQTVVWLAEDGGRVRAGDVVVRFDPTGARRELEDGRSDAAAARHKLERARVEGEAKTRGLALDRDVAAQESAGADELAARDPTIFSRHEILASELDRGLAETRKIVAERKLAASASLVGAQQGLAQVESGKAANAISRAEQGLRALEVRAPHDGLLLLTRDWRNETVRVGETVWPGEKLAEIPDLRALQARVYVLEADAGGLEAGRPAQVRVEGAGGAPLAARVARVDALAKPRERGSPVRYFETVLALEGQGRGLKPGQRVRATLVLEQLEAVIAVPRVAVFERDGRRVVFVLDGARPRAVEVTVGRNTPSHVVIERGLAAGQRVLLRDPARALDALGAPRREGDGPAGREGAR